MRQRGAQIYYNTTCASLALCVSTMPRDISQGVVFKPYILL